MAVAPKLSASNGSREERLRTHSGYLDSLISMVPPKFYFPPDPDEMAKKFQKHVNKPAAQSAGDKLKMKMESKERKRARLDPDQLTVPQQQKVLAEQEEEERQHDRKQQQRQQQRQKEEEDDDDEDDDDEAKAEDERRPAAAASEPVGVSAALSIFKTGDASSVGELKVRLQEKLEKLRGSRGGAAKPREEREKEREQAKADKQKRKQNNLGGRDGGASSGGADAGASNGDGAAARAAAAPSVPAIFNKVAAPQEAAGEPWKAKRKLSDAQLLAKAEEAAGKRRAAAQAVASGEGGADGEGGELGIEVWQKALEKASGVKQRDDPTLLKKAMKRKERQKKKSAREWKSRTSTVAKSQLDKQKTRKDNLEARGTKNKARANKRKEVFTKRRAGFEGTAPLLN